MLQLDTINCAVCGEKVLARKHILCRKCYKIYRPYFKEQWFVELVHSQRIQDIISSYESYSLDMPPPSIEIEIKTNTRGGLKMHSDMIRDAKRLRSQGLSLRKIGKILGVSYVTVRNMLLKP